MAFTTKALSFFYKRLGPTGSVAGSTYVGYLPQFWFTASNAPVSSAFLNYPTDGAATYLTTRVKSQNDTYRALPWGSHACDFLWSVLVPSWSYSDRELQNPDPPKDWYGLRTWNYTYVSKSFHKANFPAGSTYGVNQYPITSSWKMVDVKLGSFSYIYGYNSFQPVPINNYPTFVGSQYPVVGGGVPDTSDQVAYDMGYPTKELSQIDDQYFDVGTGAGISVIDIGTASSSLATYQNDNTATGLSEYTKALKSLRLFFPTPVSGSGTTGGTDYWFKNFTGYAASELFNENGGIYNVQFTLKSYEAPLDCNPADNSYMRAFIHNVIPQAPSSSARIPGADGWYPPDNNIVYIGNGWNGTPTLNFSDPQTGYRIEKFNFNLIQYGYPAQFCLEPSIDPAYFGCIVSDVQICKIGVTTDPNFIKPTTVTQNIINQTTVVGTVTDPYQPPAP